MYNYELLCVCVTSFIYVFLLLDFCVCGLYVQENRCFCLILFLMHTLTTFTCRFCNYYLTQIFQIANGKIINLRYPCTSGGVLVCTAFLRHL